MTFAGPADSFFSFFDFGWHSHARSPASICSNTTIAQSYLSQILALITKLEANSSTNSVLQLQSANFVSYLQNTTNQALLSTNCTTFVTNLKAAQSADNAAECTRQRIASNIEQKFQQVARNATHSNGPNELDDNDECMNYSF